MTQAVTRPGGSPDSAPDKSGAFWGTEIAGLGVGNARARHQQLMAELARTATVVDTVTTEALATRWALGIIAGQVDDIETEVTHYTAVTSPDAASWSSKRAA